MHVKKAKHVAIICRVRMVSVVQAQRRLVAQRTIAVTMISVVQAVFVVHQKEQNVRVQQIAVMKV